MDDYNSYRIYQTVNKLLYNRGYHNEDMTFDEFKTKKNYTIYSETREDYPIKRGAIYVFFALDQGPKLGVKPIRTYKTEMNEKNCLRAIIITKEGITPFAKSEILEIKQNENIQIDVFTESELLFDITEHVLVPKHELLTAEEKENLLVSLKIKEHQLPKILHTDPVAKYYGFEKTNVVKITRISETAGTYLNYRIVI